MKPADEPAAPVPMRIGPRTFDWGCRTYVMGIVNVTPDSFSGDGLLASWELESGGARQPVEPSLEPAADRMGRSASPAGGALDAAVERAVEQARRMVAEGADILDVGGESTRPGHAAVSPDEEARRVVPAIAAIHAAMPDVPISIDTSKPDVAAAAVDAGASLLNDVWGVREDDAMFRLAASRGVPIVVMHNRAEARYRDVVSEVVEDLAAAIERAERAGLAREWLIVDPGIGFGKTPEHNLAVLHDLPALRQLGRPVLLGTSRKSTLGRILGGLPPSERLEATLATTALGISGGADIVRVHDVEPNVRVARVADAIVRGDRSWAT